MGLSIPYGVPWCLSTFTRKTTWKVTWNRSRGLRDHRTALRCVIGWQITMGRAGLVMIVTQQKPQILYQLGASNGQGNDHIDTLGVRPRAVSIQVEPLLADYGPSLSRSSSSRINGG
jgi:hypothetical protein